MEKSLIDTTEQDKSELEKLRDEVIEKNKIWKY